MTKMRLSVNDHAELVMRDGTVVGKLTSVTLDIDGLSVGTIGGEAFDVEKKEENPLTPTDQLFEAPDTVQVIWEHYQQTVKGAKRRKLDSTRKGVIRNALKVRSVEECRRAIDGLAASPWHNGQNDRLTEYLDIRYALKGNSSKGESNEARIDDMMAKAPKQSPSGEITVDELLRTVPSDRHWIIRDNMSNVIAAINRGDRATLEEERLLRSPGVEPIIKDGRFCGWQRVTA